MPDYYPLGKGISEIVEPVGLHDLLSRVLFQCFPGQNGAVCKNIML